MALYEYRCPACGAFDVSHPIGSAGPTEACPRCGASARRVFSSPGLSTLTPQVSRLRDLEAKSAEAPEVVSAVPPAAPRRRPSAPAHPMHTKLPRS